MSRYLKKPSKFNNLPFIEVKTDAWHVEKGWITICERLNKEIATHSGKA